MNTLILILALAAGQETKTLNRSYYQSGDKFQNSTRLGSQSYKTEYNGRDYRRGSSNTVRGTTQTNYSDGTVIREKYLNGQPYISQYNERGRPIPPAPKQAASFGNTRNYYQNDRHIYSGRVGNTDYTYDNDLNQYLYSPPSNFQPQPDYRPHHDLELDRDNYINGFRAKWGIK